jgi:hypothetical protein
MTENRDAWALWNASCTQWRVCFGGIYGMDFTAVKSIADSMGITMYPSLLSKLKQLESYELERFSKHDGGR